MDNITFKPLESSTSTRFHLGSSSKTLNNEETYMKKDLFDELRDKNDTILGLNIKIKELEKSRNELLYSVERYENDLKFYQENFRIRENEYLEAIENLQIERNKMKKILEYKEKAFDLDQRTDLEKNVEKRLNHQNKNYNNNSFENYYEIENEFKNKICNNDKYKLDLFYGFYNQLENMVYNRVTSVVYLDKLDPNVINLRLEEIFKNILESFNSNKNNQNELKNTEIKENISLKNENEPNLTNNNEISNLNLSGREKEKDPTMTELSANLNNHSIKVKENESEEILKKDVELLKEKIKQLENKIIPSVPKSSINNNSSNNKKNNGLNVLKKGVEKNLKTYTNSKSSKKLPISKK